MVRMFRDDITVTIIFFEDEYLRFYWHFSSNFTCKFTQFDWLIDHCAFWWCFNTKVWPVDEWLSCSSLLDMLYQIHTQNSHFLTARPERSIKTIPLFHSKVKGPQLECGVGPPDQMEPPFTIRKDDPPTSPFSVWGFFSHLFSLPPQGASSV